MSKRINLPALAALAIGALAIAGQAAAATTRTHEFPSVVVRYDELRLNTTAGVAQLHARLRAAAKQVCGPSDTRVLSLREAYQRCVNDALSQSVDSVGNSNLTRYHLYREGAELVAAK